MATVTQGDIASAFLRELHAPDTPLMRKAVIAWMHAESGNTITANNPWNMTLGAASETGVKTCGSWTSTSSGLTFAAFCSPLDGARASARLLLNAGHDWRKYDGVVSAAQAGNPIGFLNALAHSAWDGGRYGTKNGGTNKLLGIYAGLGGDISSVAATATTGPNASGDTHSEAIGIANAIAAGLKADAAAGKLPDGTPLGAWNGIVVFPVGHTMTASDIDYIMAQLASHGYFTNDPAGVAQSITRAILNTTIGKAWGKPLQDTLQKAFFTSATEAVPKTPLDALGTIAGAFIQILQALFDPRKWLLVLALIAGVGLTAYGGKSVLVAAR